MAALLHQLKNQYPPHGRVLCIGYGQNQSTLPENLLVASLDGGQITTTNLQALNGEVLRETNPDLVICSLFPPGSTATCDDAFALIERLQVLGYLGRIAVIGPDLPRPDLVQAELRALGPGARLTLITAAV